MRRSAVAGIVLAAASSMAVAQEGYQDDGMPSASAPLMLVAPNGLPLPPPEKPAVPVRCPPLDPTGLSEWTPAGWLPKTDANGCMPWLAHAAVFNHRETRPRVGVIVIGLGKDPVLSQRAVDLLPPRMSLGFAADAPFLDRWIERARNRGHEALVVLPVQAPGKSSDSTLPPLRADLPVAENLRRLHLVLGRAGGGYIGVVLPATPPLSTSGPALRPILKEIADRGLLLVETFRTGSTMHLMSNELGLPYSADAGWIDPKPDAAEIFANLVALERFTRRTGFALAVATAHRETIERLIDWSRDVETRNLVLAPVTGLSDCRDLCAERVRKAFPRAQ